MDSAIIETSNLKASGEQTQTSKAERKEKNQCPQCLTRIAKSECKNRFCFSCCSAVDDSCEAHALLRAKHEDNERIFDEVVMSSNRRKRHFSHHEEKFDEMSQTVVIWCLNDFIRNKKYCEDVFIAENKAKSRRILQEKRAIGKCRPMK